MFPEPLQGVEILKRYGLADSQAGCYRAAKLLPAGVVVRVGSRLLINRPRLEAYLEQGGRLGQAACQQAMAQPAA